MRSILLLLLLIVIVAFVVSVSNNEPSTSAPSPKSDAVPSERQSSTPKPQTTVAHEQSASATSTCSGIAESIGRVYDVSSVNTCQNEIPINGVKLFLQGRVTRFGYANMQSRPFAVIEDEQQPSKTVLCAMQADEGAQVMSLYRVGEVVQVSGDFMGVAPIVGNLSMPVLSDCTMASSTDKVISLSSDVKREATDNVVKEPRQTFMTVGDFLGHGEFSTYTVVNVEGRVKESRCGMAEGRELCWLLLEDVPNEEAGHWHGGELMMWVKNYDWDEVHSLYKVGDVARMTCTAFVRGAYDCKAAKS